MMMMMMKCMVNNYHSASTYPISDALAIVVYLLIQQLKESRWIELEVLNAWLFRWPWSLNNVQRSVTY